MKPHLLAKSQSGEMTISLCNAILRLNMKEEEEEEVADIIGVMWDVVDEAVAMAGGPEGPSLHGDMGRGSCSEPQGLNIHKSTWTPLSHYRQSRNHLPMGLFFELTQQFEQLSVGRNSSVSADAGPTPGEGNADRSSGEPIVPQTRCDQCGTVFW